MNIKELLKVLKNNKNCNFIAFVETILQANSIDATIAYLTNSGITVNGYVLIVHHKTTDRIVTPDKFVNNNPDIKYIDCDNSKINSYIFDKLFSTYFNFISKKNNYDNFYIAGASIGYRWIYWLNKVFPKRNFKFIILEDGYGCYANRFNNSLNFVKRDFGNSFSILYFLAYIKFCFNYLLEFINYRLAEKKRNLIRATIYLKKEFEGKTKLVRNDCMTIYYQEVFRLIGNQLSKDKLKIFEKSVLINTQPLNRFNVIDGNVDFKIYSKTIEILKSLNLPVIIKPHPREPDYKKYEKFGCIVFNDNSYTQESILANLSSKPKCVISIFSSTLLNATGIFKVPAISLAKIILKENIDELFSKQLKDYIDRYKDLIFFPDSYKELTDYLLNSN